MASISDLSKGNYMRYNGEVMKVEELQHRTPGNLRAFYQIKMRNVKNGRIVENRFRPGDSAEILRVETKEYNYLYQDGESLVCMDNETFDQIYLSKSYEMLEVLEKLPSLNSELQKILEQINSEENLINLKQKKI